MLEIEPRHLLAGRLLLSLGRLHLLLLLLLHPRRDQRLFLLVLLPVLLEVFLGPPRRLVLTSLPLLSLATRRDGTSTWYGTSRRSRNSPLLRRCEGSSVSSPLTMSSPHLNHRGCSLGLGRSESLVYCDRWSTNPSSSSLSRRYDAL